MQARLRACRQELPEYVAAIKYFESPGRLESQAWKLQLFDTQQVLELPRDWKVQADPTLQGKQASWFEPDFNDASWSLLSTHECLENQGLLHYKYAWYRTKFTLPSKFYEQEARLCLGAVDESCEIWLNGKYVATFRYDAKKDKNSWNKPQYFMITPWLKEGENQLTVLLENRAFNGGIWRPSFITFREKVLGERFFEDFSAAVPPWSNLKGAEIMPQISLAEEDGIKMIRMEGRPDKASNGWAFSSRKLPFVEMAGKKFRFGGRVKCANMLEGSFEVAIREVDKDGETIVYQTIRLRTDTDWKDLEKSFRAHHNTQTLQFYVLGVDLNAGSVCHATHLFVEQLVE